MTEQEYQAIPKTERGFCVFGEIPCKSGTVDVVESSIAFEGAHVRIYLSNPTHTNAVPHMSVPQTKRLIAALQQFVAAAEAGHLIEPAGEE